MSCNKQAPLPEFTPSDIPDLTGYVAIVTGGEFHLVIYRPSDCFHIYSNALYL